MEYIKASDKNIDDIFHVVQKTITTIYPKYYPKEVVDFFCEHHCRETIAKDIEKGNINILVDHDQMVGTGSRDGNHITRVYVLPEFQGKGYGSFIMNYLEDEIAVHYSSAILDASLPASGLYEHRGYHTIKHEKHTVENDVVLVYEVMEKTLSNRNKNICYGEKRFRPRLNTENGEVNGETVFCYHQQGNEIWAEYAGGEINKGFLIGFVEENGELDFYYQHVNAKHQIRVGKCHSIPKLLDNGKLELSEQWQWLNGDMSKGSSVVIEI